MPRYRVNGKTYSIPDDKVAGFEARYPEATIEYHNEGKTYQIPLSKRDGFLSRYPKATYEAAEPIAEPAASPAATAEDDAVPAMPVEEAAAKPKQTVQDRIRMSARVNQMMQGTQRMMDGLNERKDTMREYIDKSQLGFGQTVEGKPTYNPEHHEIEKTYITPLGNRYVDKEIADAESFQFRQSADMSVSGQLRRATQRLADLRAKREASAQRVHEQAVKEYENNKAPLAAVLFADTYSARQMSDKENAALDVAIRNTEELIKDLKEQQDRERGKDVGFWRGFGRVAGDYRTWDFGMSDLRDAMTMLQADELKGEKATQGEREAYNEMMGSIYNKEQAEQMYGDNASFWNRAGVMTGYMPSFMLDFAITGGGFDGVNFFAKGAGKAATKVIGKEAIKEMTEQGFKAYVKSNGISGLGQYAGNWTIKALGTMGDDLLVRAPMMTNTVQFGKTTADIIDRKLGDVVVNMDGTYDFSNDKTWSDAVWQGEANAIIENYSEMFGTHLDPVVTFGNMSKLANVLGAKRLSNVLAKADAGALSGIMGDTQKLFNKMGVSDYLGEVTEEYYGQLWRTMLNLDDAYQQNADGTRTNLLATGKFHGDIWGGMALSMGLLSAGKYTLTASRYASMKHSVNKADANANELLGKEIWEPLKQRIDLTTNDDIGSVAEGIVNDNSFTDEERAAVLTYMERSMNLRGFNLATLAEKRGGEQNGDVQALNESYLDGYNIGSPQEMTDAKNELDYQRQKVSGIVDEDMMSLLDTKPMTAIAEIQNNGVWSDEARTVMLDYLNAKQVYDGMLQRVRDDIDGRIEQSNAIVDARVNRTTGMIQPATMKDDRQVYVISGNLVQYADESGIDNKASDESIIVRDAESGALEQVAPDAVLNIDEALDPAKERETAANVIRQQYAQEAADKIDGVATFNIGDTYTITGDDEQKQVQIAANEQGIVDNGDGTVNVTDGTNIFPIAKETIQQQVDAANLARIQQFEEQRAIENNAIKQSTQDAYGPQYALNDAVVLTDENGQTVRGSITTGADADGRYEVETEKPINGKRVNLFTREELDGMLVEYIGEGVGNGSENGNNGAENIPADSQVAEQQSALERIPKDEKGNALYEQTDSDTAWDAIVEQTGGDETMAQTVADGMLADKEAALKKLERTKVKGGATVAEKIAAEKDRKAAIDAAKQDVEAWKKIAGTAERRRLDADAAKRRDAEQAEVLRRAEEERMRAEREEAERKEREALNGVPDMVDDTPQDARARGYRRMSGHKIDRPMPVEGLQGKDVSVKFSDDAIANGRVAVIEAEQLQPSHIEGQRNPWHFIDEAQPKERNDKASVLSSRKIAESIRPEEITTSVTAYTGAPTVNARGEVIQGNNRSDALRQMWDGYQDQAAKYKQYLMDHAQDFGLNAEDISGMKHPVLVNMLDVDDAEAIKLGQYVAQDTESGGVERIKAKNTINKMGKNMRSFANLLLKSTDDETTFAGLVDKNGVEVLKWMSQKGYISPTQYQSSFDSKGNLTAEAKNDLRDIMYQSIFAGGSTRLEEMFNAMPAKAQKAILATAFRDYDSPSGERMIEEIQNSIRAYYALSQSADFANAKTFKEARLAVEGWKIQYQIDDASGESYLPADNFSNFALLLATMYKGENQSVIQGTFNKLYDLIQGTQEENLFEQPDNTPRTLAQAIKETLNITYDGQRRSNVLAGNSAASQRGQQGSEGNAATGERVENRERTADGGGRTESDSGQGGLQGTSSQGVRQVHGGITETPLTDAEIDELMSLMEENASETPQIELNPQNWEEQFGETGMVSTPIGVVKMGDNQIAKLFEKGRSKQFGMIKPTLETPHVVVEVSSTSSDGETERATSLLFIKTFKETNGEKIYYFKSVTVKKDGLEVSISNHYDREKRVRDALKKGKLQYRFDGSAQTEHRPANVSVTASPEEMQGKKQEGDVIWRTPKDTTTSSAERQGLDYEQPNKAETAAKGSGITPQSTPSESKDTTNPPTTNELGEKNDVQDVKEKVSAAEADVNTSPTEAQKEAGNYKKGHLKIDGFDVSIEQPKGSVRRGTDASGKQWEQTMNNTYGYLRGTEGVDGDHIDVFLSEDPSQGDVFVVDQVNKDGTFDEHKVMYGFADEESAKQAYLANYEEGWTGLGAITHVSKNEFKKWVQSSHRKTKPFAEYKGVKTKQDVSPTSETSLPVHKDFAKYMNNEAGTVAMVSGDGERGYVVRYYQDEADVNAGLAIGEVMMTPQELKEKLDSGKFRREEATAPSESKNGDQDNQGNPLNADGTLKLDKVKSVDELTDEDFTSPTRNVQLPKLPKKVDAAIGAGGKPVVIKKNIFARNAGRHSELTPSESRDIISSALYNPDLYGQNQKARRPYNWVVINTKDREGRNRLVLLEVNANKDNLEIVHWHYLREESLETIKRQAEREGGLILMLPSEKPEEAGGLSSRTQGLSDEGKVSESEGEKQGLWAEKGKSPKTESDANETMEQKTDDATGKVILYHKADGSVERISERETVLRDALVGKLRESGIDVETDSEEGQRVLDEVNGDVRMQAELDGLRKASDFILTFLKGETRQRSSKLEIPERANRLAEQAIGHKINSHTIKANELTHAKKRHGVNGTANTKNSIPLRDEDFALMPYIMSAPTRIVRGNMASNGTESVRYEKDLSDGIVIVVEREGRFDVSDMENITMRAQKKPATNVTVAQRASHSTSETIVISEADAAKIRKDAENAISNDVKLREQKVYHGSGNDFEEFDFTHMGEGEGNQSFGWGGYVTETEGIGRRYAGVGYSTSSLNRSRLEMEIRRAEERLPFSSGEVKTGLEDDIKQMREKLDSIKDRDGRFLYTLDIPDDNGNNYLAWDKPVGDKRAKAVTEALYEHIVKNDEEELYADEVSQKELKKELASVTGETSGGDLYGTISSYLGSNEAASKFLDGIGIIGVKYPSNFYKGGNAEGKSNYVVFNEKNLTITDKVRFFRTADGHAYGFVKGGKIYIDGSIASAETPIHEYSHLWADGMRRNNPDEWNNVIELMKDTPIWEEVKKKYPELEGDDEIADEVLAQYSGRRGAERLRAEQERVLNSDENVVEKAAAVSAIERVKESLKRFWRAVAEWFNVHFTTAEEVADRVLTDMLNGVNPIGSVRKTNSDVRDAQKIGINDRAAQREFLFSGNYVSSLTGKEFAKSDTPLTEKVSQYYAEKYDGKVEREGVGVVLLDERSIKDSIAHGIGRNKAIAFAAVPEIIKSGVIVDIQENWKGRGRNSVTFAAPLEIGKRPFIGVVIAKEISHPDGTHRFYLHEVVLKENLLSEEFKTSSITGSKQGDVAKVLKEIIAAKENAGNISEDMLTDMLNGVNPLKAESQKTDKDVKAFHDVIDAMFDDKNFDRAAHSRERYEIAATPEWMKSIGIVGDKFSLSFKNIKTHQGKDADHDLSREEWHRLPEAIKEPFLVTKYKGVKDRFRLYVNMLHNGNYVAVGIDVKRVNQGKNKPILEVNSVKTVFGHHGEISTGETIISYDERITPEQQALLRGLNFREYPTIQELTATKIVESFENAKVSGENAEDMLYRSDDAIKNRIEALFNQAISGEFKGKPISIGRLTDAGKAYLEQVSDVSFKDKVDFVLNPSDLVHIYKGHFGNNETDERSIPLNIEDIRNIADVVSFPDRIIYSKENENEKRKMFFFLKEAENGTYNLLEIYADKKGNLTAKTFYKTKEGVSQRAMTLSKSLHTTSETDGATLDDGAKIPQMFESTSIDGEISAREGDGAYSDDEISYENDPWSKAMGKSIRTRKQRMEYAALERKRMKERVESLAKELNLDNVDVITDASQLEGKKQRAKGFYSKSTGKITIVIPNHISAYDVEQTLLHEAVAHYGLRKLFGEHFDTFLDNVFNNADEAIRRTIVELASKNGWDFRTATEEYLAGLAEDINYGTAQRTGWWQKIKDFFIGMLHKIGFEDFSGVTLSDNELRYILWRSYWNLAEPGWHRNILLEAGDTAKQYELKVGNFAVSDNSISTVASNNDELYRDGDPEIHEQAIARDRYERRVKSGMFQSQEALQDSMLGLKEAMQAIHGKEKYIEDVDGFENAYLGENRLSSVNKSEADAFARLLFKPMLDEVAKLARNEAERKALTDYMMAKHGLERNEYMRKQAEANDEETERDFAGLTALTGMDNVADAEAEARQMVLDYEDVHDTTDLWEKVNAVSKAILQKSYECGMMSKETYDKVSGMYEFYIPLRGFDETTSAEAYAYLTHKNSAFNAPIKKAEGRSSKADDPFANLESMAESAIMQGNRNKLVKQRFLNFALNHPSDLVSVSDLWLKYDETIDEWQPVFPDNIESTDTPEEVEQKMLEFNSKMEQLCENDATHYKKGKDAVGIPYRVVESRDMRQHQVVVRRNGRDYVITINGNPRAAQALNGQTNPDNDMSGAIGALLRASEKINRQLSAFYTTRNPDFIVSNFIRDMLYTNIITWIKESPNYALRFHRNYIKVNPVKMKQLLAKHRKGTLDMSDRTEAMFHQFMMNGGETGYANIRDIEQHKNDIRKELKRANGKLKLSRAWSLLAEKFDELNRAVENCARFAAFMTSREMGRSIDRAIYDAKEISVNFNKKGSGAKFLDSVGQTRAGKASAFVSGLGRSGFVFWNAAIQGTTNFGRQVKRHPAKAFTGVAALFLLGAIVAYLGGDDDDDDKNAYYNLPEYVRRSNILFRAGDSWVSIPLPIEYRAFYGMGELMTSVLSGKEHLTGGEIAEAITSQATQILPIDFMEGGGGINAFIPSAVKPFWEAYVAEKSWTGMPLYKDTPYNKDMPEWTKAYKSSNKYIVGLAAAVNEASGGDPYTKGSIEFNPAKVEYLLNGYFGGVFGTIDKMTKSAETIVGAREYDPRSILLVNRLVKAGDERTEYRAVNNEYERLKKEHDRLKTRLKHYEDDTDNGIFDYAEKIDFLYNSPEYERYEIFEYYRKDIDALYDELKETVDDKERKDIEAELNELKKEMIGEMNLTRKRK